MVLGLFQHGVPSSNLLQVMIDSMELYQHASNGILLHKRKTSEVNDHSISLVSGVDGLSRLFLLSGVGVKAKDSSIQFGTVSAAKT